MCHAVDRSGELGNLTFGLHQQLLFKIAVRDGGHHSSNAAHLIGQVYRHEIHVVSQILPGPGDAFYHRLTPELSFSTDFTRHARHFFDKSPVATAVVTSAMLRT